MAKPTVRVQLDIDTALWERVKAHLRKRGLLPVPFVSRKLTQQWLPALVKGAKQ